MLTWDFEVWNEANLSVFWSASRAEWMKLYDVTAAAVKGVDPRLAVGGPSSAAAGWVDELLEHVRHSGSPLDFVTTHTYGNAPLDLRPTLERFGSTARIVWTEWGVTPTHFNPVNDSVSSATFLLHGMKSSAGRLDALSYWVASDHFEELGRPPRMLHGGFGLITVGGIAKSRYHALHLLSRLGETQLPVVAEGDGADGLVQAWASRHDDGSLTVLVWNHTLDQGKATGDPALARTVRLRLDGLDGLDAGTATVTRLDADHGDVATLAERLGVGDWPTDEQWEQLWAADRLTDEPVELERRGRRGLRVRLAPPAVGGAAPGRRPKVITAAAGVGQVTLTWPEVADAVGYVVHHGATSDALAPLDHGGGDLLVVPCLPYADTRREAGGWYAVAAVRSIDDGPGEPGPPVHCVPLPHDPSGAAPAVVAAVDVTDRRGPLPRPWRDCIGSEHLSHLLCDDRTGGRPIGEESVAALSRVHTELGVRRVRAHGTLGDDLDVYREDADGRPVHDFDALDKVLDTVLSTGLRPVLELGFTPRALGDAPWHEITAAGLANPPNDLGRWAGLVEAFVTHLRERYGDHELDQGWVLEVWNEPNLDCFWTGDRADYLRLYDATVAAVRRAHPTIPVAGPATAAVGWLDAFLDHVTDSGSDLDLITPHAYGIPPLDVRAALRRHGREDVGVWWTEWGPTPTHFHPVNDHPWVATFTARGMLAAARQGAAVACWVASDHFEELGRPPELVHGGFGLLSVGNLAKPRFWALRALELLGDEEVGVHLEGDGADSMVQAWASCRRRSRNGWRSPSGTAPCSSTTGRSPATTCGARCASSCTACPPAGTPYATGGWVPITPTWSATPPSSA